MSTGSNRWFGRHRDLLAASASAFVGALALATSTYNVYLQRQQVRAQVWPRLNLDEDWTDDVVTLQVQNRGAGPAEIRRVRVTVDGQIKADWVDVLSALLRLRTFPLPLINQLEDQVMSPGQMIAPLKIEGPNAIALLEQRRRLGVGLCYCSSLGDCWELRVPNLAESPQTVQVSGCPQDPKPFRSLQSAILDQALAAQRARTSVKH